MRTVGVKLTADVSAYMSGIKRAQETTKGFVGDMAGAAKKGNLDAVADKAAIAGVGLLGFAGVAIKSAADFDKAMSSVSAATHAPQAELDQLRAAALQAGKDTSFSATEAADGITELSKAGVSTADVLNGGLKGALSLAAAGQLSVGEAAETAASALTQFKLQGSQVPHVADLLAAGAGKAQGSVHDLGGALNQSGLVAAQFGLSIEDTTGALAEFASAGLTGSDAGTSLKTMLLAIANPSQQTKAAMDALGISFYDATGKFVGLNGVAQILQSRLHGLTDEQRQATLGQIFGSDAIRSASILYSDGAAGVDKWKNAVNDSGYAAETAQKQTDNLAGDIERLKGSIETLAIESGGGANSGLRVLTKTLNGIVDSIDSMGPAATGTVVVLAGLAGALLLGGGAWLKYKKTIQEVQEQLIATGPAGEKAAAGLSKVTGAAGKAAFAFVALEGASMVLNAFGPKAANVDRLADSLTNLANTGKISGEIADKFGDDLSGINDDAGVATNGVVKWINKVEGSIPIVGDLAKQATALGARIAGKDDYDTALQNFAGLDTALTNTMTQLGDAKKASDLWNQVLTKSGLDTQQLAELLPNAYKEVGALNTAADQGKGAVGGMGDAAKGAAGQLGDMNSALDVGAAAQDKWTDAAADAAGAAKGERDAMVALADELHKSTDPVFGLIDAEDKLTKAKKTSASASDKYGKSSEQAKKANRDLALAAIDLTDAVGKTGNAFDGKITPALRATLHAAGLTDSEIDSVAASFRDAKKDGDAFAKNYRAPVSTPGVSASVKGLKDLKYEINTLKGKTVTIHVRQVADGRERVDLSGHRVGGYSAKGGPITGPGPKGVDSEVRMLAPGEHVLTASEVDAMGGQSAVSKFRSDLMKHHAAAVSPAPARMTPYAAASQTVIVESKSIVEFAGRLDQFGSLFLNMLRTSPAVRTEAASILKKAG